MTGPEPHCTVHADEPVLALVRSERRDESVYGVCRRCALSLAGFRTVRWLTVQQVYELQADAQLPLMQAQLEHAVSRKIW